MSYKRAVDGFVHDVNGTYFYPSSPSQNTPLVCKIIPVTWFLPYFNLAGKTVIHGFSFGVEKKSSEETPCK